jgi:hypothetical protein
VPGEMDLGDKCAQHCDTVSGTDQAMCAVPSSGIPPGVAPGPPHHTSTTDGRCTPAEWRPLQEAPPPRRGHAGTCWDMRGRAQTCGDIRGRAETCGDMRGCGTMHKGIRKKQVPTHRNLHCQADALSVRRCSLHEAHRCSWHVLAPSSSDVLAGLREGRGTAALRSLAEQPLTSRPGSNDCTPNAPGWHRHGTHIPHRGTCGPHPFVLLLAHKVGATRKWRAACLSHFSTCACPGRAPRPRHGDAPPGSDRATLAGPAPPV